MKTLLAKGKTEGNIQQVLLNPPTTDHLPIKPPNHCPTVNNHIKRLKNSNILFLRNTNATEKESFTSFGLIKLQNLR